MRKTLILLTSILMIFSCKTKQSISKTAKSFQQEMNSDYGNPASSPLTQEGLSTFSSLDFFPIDDKYIVTATFNKTKDALPFKMKTTTDRLPVYEQYGEVSFLIDGIKYHLNIYQSHSSRASEKYKDYLFLPFFDDTNGDSSYGGGRYIDLRIPKGDTIVIDFNQAYNPYCAYNSKYSCPITPNVNTLPIAIKAGVMKYKGKH